ncbi:MAG: hypothetical protein IT350_17505 [Deltaproteobacteria bacterium]|nr:hypothetical protein [Deltaproteobacteria bacterium]
MTSASIPVTSRFAAHAALVALVAIAAYAPVFVNEFTYDARLVVGDNPAVADPANLAALFSGEYFTRFGENTYRPVVSLTYMIDAALLGRSIGAFGASSLAWHVLAVVGFLVVARRRVGAWPALAAALVYAAHPAPSEAVFCVGHREAILGGAAVWWAIAAHDRASKSPAHRTASLAIYAVGMFAIESVILVPAYLAVETWIAREDGRCAALRRVWPFAVLAVAFVLGREFVFAGTRGETPFYGGSWLSALAAAFAFFARYVALAFWPNPLAPDYAASPIAQLAPSTIAGMVIAVAMTWLVATRRGAVATRLGIAWFAASLLLVSHVLVPFWIPMAERYLYVGIGAFALALVAPLVSASLDIGLSRSRMTLVFACALALLIAATHLRGRDWRDDLSLWSRAVATQPRSPVAWSNLADALSARGDQRGRKEALARLVEIDPQNFGAMDTLVTMALRERRTVDARAWIARMTNSGAPSLMIERARAQTAIAESRFEEAGVAAAACLDANPREGLCLQAAAFIAFSRGDDDLAARRFDECAREASADMSIREACERGLAAANARRASRENPDGSGVFPSPGTP